MTSRRSVLLLATLGALLSCCCVGVLSFSSGPADSVCNDATQTPTGHGVPAQTSAAPYQLVVVGVTSYDSSDTSTPVTGSARAYVWTSCAFTDGSVTVVQFFFAFFYSLDKAMRPV